MLEFFISLLRHLLIYFCNFQTSIRAHVGPRALAPLQMELYRVVDYNSTWSTKIYEDYMLDFFKISL